MVKIVQTEGCGVRTYVLQGDFQELTAVGHEGHHSLKFYGDKWIS